MRSPQVVLELTGVRVPDAPVTHMDAAVMDEMPAGEPTPSDHARAACRSAVSALAARGGWTCASVDELADRDYHRHVDGSIDWVLLFMPVEGAVSAMWPATALQWHPHVTVLVDEAACARLQLAPYFVDTFEHKPDWQGF